MYKTCMNCKFADFHLIINGDIIIQPFICKNEESENYDKRSSCCLICDLWEFDKEERILDLKGNKFLEWHLDSFGCKDMCPFNKTDERNT